MSLKTVVVESPTKAKTISKYLGKDYNVVSSFGHMRDLVSKDGSVDPSNNFKMVWETSPRSKKHVQEIKGLLKKSDTLLLATDPDREGEAISWHISEIFKKELKDINVQRIVFHEITKPAIEEAIKSPRNLNQELVEAYLARRALDYLFGFTLSPVLWRKLPGAKSAGRVQSVALRLIVEREEEIEQFKAQEYWDVIGLFDPKVEAKLSHFDGKKLEKFTIENEKQAKDIVTHLKKQKFAVDKIEAKKVSRNPLPPYITSTLQQDASNKLGFSASRTMKIAQQLYEGLNIKGSVTGLITYMRTDSVSMSKEALTKIRDYIKDNFSKEYLPKTSRGYKSKVKNAQEAHECIRPAHPDLAPDVIRNVLNDDQYKVYSLIWKRSIASQMANAEFLQTKIDIASDNKKDVFRANGQVCEFKGFLSVYQIEEDENNKTLPPLKKGDDMTIKSITPNQHFTQPPPRYNEGSLIKKLEELGIGRPSTYASLIETLKERKYVILEKRRFTPDLIGRFVVLFLKEYFPKYIEYDFTAHMEENLDAISSGGQDFLKVLSDFWSKFSETVDGTKELRITQVIDYLEKAANQVLFTEFTDRKCPKCSDGSINLKLSKFGAFLGCSKYPECKFTSSLKGEKAEGEQTQVEEKPKDIELGEKDNVKYVLKKGPYGFYFQCQKKKEKKPKNIKLPNFIDPSEATIDHASFLFSLPREIAKLDGYPVLLDTGRFGPYVKWNNINASLPKGANIFEFSGDEAEGLITKKRAKST